MEHEERFPIYPRGVRYRCEFCEEGEQEYVSGEMNQEAWKQKLFPHRCNKCGKTMMLPKTYPFIEWTKGEEVTEDE